MTVFNDSPNLLYVFGGYSINTTTSRYTYRNDLWVFDISTSKWEKLSKNSGLIYSNPPNLQPSPRC